jgi:hypothetical protein
MSADLDRLRSTPQSAPTPTATTPPMHQTASGCSAVAENSALPLAQLNTAPTPRVHELSTKQLQALDELLFGNSDDFICTRLRVDRSTLYRWKHRHPLFMAELNRRHQEVWTNLAAGLRVTIASALKTMRFHLHSANDMTQLRAARTLFQMAKASQLIPATGPIDPREILDQLLRQQQQQQSPTSAANANANANAPAANATAFTDAQRQSLLDQLIDEDTTALAAADAQALARRQARKARKSVAHTPADTSTTPPT